jgi:hypothetical protein
MKSTSPLIPWWARCLMLFVVLQVLQSRQLPLALMRPCIWTHLALPRSSHKMVSIINYNTSCTCGFSRYSLSYGVLLLSFLRFKNTSFLISKQHGDPSVLMGIPVCPLACQEVPAQPPALPTQQREAPQPEAAATAAAGGSCSLRQRLPSLWPRVAVKIRTH